MTAWFRSQSFSTEPALLLLCPICGSDRNHHGGVHEFVRTNGGGPS